MGVATGGEWKSQYGRHKTGMIGVGWLLNDDGKKMNRNTVKGILDVFLFGVCFLLRDEFFLCVSRGQWHQNFPSWHLSCCNWSKCVLLSFSIFDVLGVARILLHPKIALFTNEEHRWKAAAQMSLSQGGEKVGKGFRGQQIKKPKTSVWIAWKKRCVFFVWCWTWRMEWDFSSKWL